MSLPAAFKVVALLLPLAVGGAALPIVAQSSSARTLDIYVIDVEGGNATLFVSPSKASLLVDSGNGGPDSRSTFRN